MKRESKFQTDLKKKIKKIFPGCFVLKIDPSQCQGIPDLLILYKNKWATLECKRSEKETFQPNQKHYVGVMNAMSFSRVIYPENEEEVLNELQRAFKS